MVAKVHVHLVFICILFAKLTYDYLLQVFNLLLFQGIIFLMNKSLHGQILKFPEKNYNILWRDFSLVTCIVAYQILTIFEASDQFGLLVTPDKVVTIELPANLMTNMDLETASAAPNEKSAAAMVLSHLTFAVSQVAPNVLENAIKITTTWSVEILIYCVAINDLVLKLLTILLKITIAMLPTNIIGHDQMMRLFALVEYFSQFCRALAPIRQWLIFLYESNSSLELISEMFFPTIYMGLKGYELFQRGKYLREAYRNFIRCMDYDHQPTKEDLKAAGAICPICRDAYKTPVVLQCGHIFCNNCVSAWFEQNQTCPLCRAPVIWTKANKIEDLTWQDGFTLRSYQLY